MSALTLCADSNCENRGSCFRYTADPIVAMKEMRSKKVLRVESSLRSLEERSCSKYWPIHLTITETKTNYEIRFQD